MDKVSRDDFIYALEQTMAFYGKDINNMQITFWVDACRDKSVEKLKMAFREHVRCGKYAPRPADILGIVDNMAQRQGRNELPPPQASNCPPEIAEAWMWFVSHISKGSKNMDGLFSDAGGVDIETQERYLHTVNHEAMKHDMPESIPDDFKLKEVWA